LAVFDNSLLNQYARRYNIPFKRSDQRKILDLLLIIPKYFDTEGINYSYSFPLGLPYISAVLKQAGHRVDCLNLNHYSGTVQELIDRYLRSEKQYDHVMTGGLSTDYNQIKKVADAVHKASPKTGLIMGGAIISSEPELMFNDFGLNYALVGEAEETVRELFECIGKKGDLNLVAGIGFKDPDGKFILTKPRENIKDLESIPWPDLEGFEYAKYLDHLHPNFDITYDLFDHPRPYPLICSRSCPFTCTFCFHPLGNRYRQRGIGSVMQEVKVMIERYHINLITIYDELFTNDREWLFEFCRQIKEFFKTLPWECKWICQMRVIDVDEEMLSTMKDAGCIMVSYGFESYSPTVLKSMRKHITPERIDYAIQTTLRHNISIQGNFIFGDVAETPATAKETLDYYKKNSHAGIFLTLINPYPGSKIYEHCVKKGIIKDRIDFISNHIYDAINMTDTMTEKEYQRMVFDIFSTRLKYMVKAKKQSIKKMPDGTYNVKAKCPHCGAMNDYKNYMLASRHVFNNKAAYCRSCRHRYFLVSPIVNLAERSWLLIGTILPGSTYYLFKTMPFIKKCWKRLKFLIKRNKVSAL
jgi:anaerobic magnesium-protoporphyrin IX monomethyl ester cyclase